MLNETTTSRNVRTYMLWASTLPIFSLLGST